MRTRPLWFAPLLLAATVSISAPVLWLSREFVDSWDTPGASVEEFLNRDCKPSGLDGIQVFAVQKGHGSAFNLHLSCRRDGAVAVRYTVTMLKVTREHLDDRVTPLVSNPRVRIGPFFFGKVDASDGVDEIGRAHV